MLSILQRSPYIIFTRTPRNTTIHILQMRKQTERNEITCPRLHNQCWNQGINHGLSGTKAHTFKYYAILKRNLLGKDQCFFFL